MPKKKNQSLLKRRHMIKMIAVPLLIVALVLFGGVQLMRITSLEKDVSNMEMESFMNIANAYYSPLPIDGLHKQSYIPELNVVLPYDSELSGALRYTVDQADAAHHSGTLHLTTASELRRATWTNGGLSWNGCRTAFFVSIGTNDTPADATNVIQKVLQDGRRATIQKSTVDDCQAFVTSTNGDTLRAMLENIQSY